MTSAAKIAANRANGRKSRGPRTAAGKSRTRLNALRHGLSAGTINNPATSRDVQRIATFLSEDDRDALLRAEATTIAECEVTLARIRAARVAALDVFGRAGGLEADKLTFGKRVRARAWQQSSARRKKMTPMEEIEALRRALPRMARIDRYERRVWSRRKWALRNFADIKCRTTGMPPRKSGKTNPNSESESAA